MAKNVVRDIGRTTYSTSNFQSPEIVYRGSETQFQVTKNLNFLWLSRGLTSTDCHD